MKRKKYSAILKGSLTLTAVLLMESSGLTGQQLIRAAETQETAEAEGNSDTTEVSDTAYGKYRTFDVNRSAESAKEGDVIGEESGNEENNSDNSSTNSASSVGDKFSHLGEGNRLSGLPGKIPSAAEEQNKTAPEETPGPTDSASAAVQEYKTTDITDPATGLKVARAYAPVGYTIDGQTIWNGKWQSLGAPAQVYLTAISQDENTVMGYYSPVCYEQILEYSQNGYSLMEHQDGAFDSQTLTPMLTFMTADTYCDYMAQTILPGQQLEFCSQEEITGEMQNLMDTKADELYQQTCQLLQGTGYNVDGAYVGAAQREYQVSLNGYPFKFIILSVTEGTQLSYSEEFAYNMGTVNQTMIAWDSPGCYFMLTPEEECETNKDIFNQFGSNTTVSDQFTQALANVRNQITQSGGQNYSSMSDITGECQSSMSSSMGSEDTYTMTDQFSDYIFDQNDYTLSNGDHVKVPSSYDYVYEGTDGNVYVSDSSFDQPGGSTQLDPN